MKLQNIQCAANKNKKNKNQQEIMPLDVKRYLNYYLHNIQDLLELEIFNLDFTTTHKEPNA